MNNKNLVNMEIIIPSFIRKNTTSDYVVLKNELNNDMGKLKTLGMRYPIVRYKGTEENITELCTVEFSDIIGYIDEVYYDDTSNKITCAVDITDTDCINFKYELVPCMLHECSTGTPPVITLTKIRAKVIH